LYNVDGTIVPQTPRFSASDRIRVVLASSTLVSYGSVWRAAVRALVELGCAGFFVAGVAWASVGSAAPWYVLAAVALSVLLRAVDVEARALFVPGGLFGLVRDALGIRAARVAVSALTIERLMLAPLAAVVAGHYLVALVPRISNALPGARPLTGHDGPVAVAMALLAGLWLLQRRGRPMPDRTVNRAIGVSIGVIVVIAGWGLATAWVRHTGLPPFHLPPVALWTAATSSRPPVWIAALSAMVAFASGIGFALPALGSVDVLSQVTVDLPQPRIRNLRRIVRLAAGFGLLAAAGFAFLLVLIVPETQRATWVGAPLAGVARSLVGPVWLRAVALIAVSAAALVMLAAAARSAAASAHGVLSRLVEEGLLDPALRALHPRFGTPWRLIDATAVVQLGVVLVSGGEVPWLARVYAIGLAWSAVLKAFALIRLRARRPGARPYRVRFNVVVGGREWPVGLWLAALGVAVPATSLLAVFDGPSIAGALLLIAMTVLLVVVERSTLGQEAARRDLDEFQLLPSDDEDLTRVEARPGNVLVPVRRPGTLSHLTAALRAAGDRDVVAMTVRLVGLDVPDDPTADPHATADERRLLSAVVAVAEREARPVHLLIAPGANVFDAVVETALRLESAEIHVGESETLSADDQARLLGEAWERAPHSRGADVRLVVHHPGGGTAAYHLGAHAPALKPEDFDIIHRLWLDAANAIGPHVHHRDVVRAALTLMEQQLSGPGREAALQQVRETARPADELAAVIRQRDFGRLRDMVRNRPASDLGAVLTDLSLEDQVLVFRILPRKAAAATFEYLSPEDQHGLLKAMASEDVARLLNDMAPDDRTMFLEELPAEVTRHLLAQLTPEERAVAVGLLGYPERSIGRRMTPQYIAAREDWTIQQVLDYIRAHGEDSETLNVIYVVDDRGVLIDDISIRALLLAPPSELLRSVMDRRFVALKATDDQETAVVVFKTEDRTALPVTDSAGVLIGIVTIDDMLDIAEAEATEDIQRFGGSEALDEPYMQIKFARMIQKRAGWLTALFLGEMLTATAMGFFEHEIEKAVILALFVPLIISSGGNSGSQASTLVIRALALGEVKLRDWWRVMRREIGAGLALGGILGTIGFMRITIWSRFSSIYGEHWLLVAVTVALALVGVVLWGTLVGSLLPFLLRRLGFDPAVSSAPFVATLVDVTGLVIYFSVGLVILRGTLL
jgi:magnesium transporter